MNAVILFYFFSLFIQHKISRHIYFRHLLNSTFTLNHFHRIMTAPLPKKKEKKKRTALIVKKKQQHKNIHCICVHMSANVFVALINSLCWIKCTAKTKPLLSLLVKNLSRRFLTKEEEKKERKNTACNVDKSVNSEETKILWYSKQRREKQNKTIRSYNFIFGIIPLYLTLCLY